MKRQFFVLFCIALICLCTVSVCGLETVIYENDFSQTSLTDFEVHGNWSVSNGYLTLGSGTGASGYLTYEIPAEHADKDYRLDVDFLGHTGLGGFLIGADGPSLSAAPSYFFGYHTAVTSDGKAGVFAYFNQTGGWGANLRRGPSTIDEADLHLSVYVDKKENTLTYRITSLDGERQLFGMTYEIGTHDDDTIYERFSSTVGIRKAYAGAGTFDNFKITVFEDDAIGELTKSVGLCGTAFRAESGITGGGASVTGRGALLTEEALAADFCASAKLSCAGITRVFFGMKDLQNGYAFCVDADEEIVELYQITNGAYSRVGRKRAPVPKEPCEVRVSVNGGVASLYYDNFAEGAAAFPKFEFSLADYAAGSFGFWLSGGTVSDFALTGSEAYIGETYLNPVVWGADPDILYYDGTYYLYNRNPSGDSVFSVYTSPDLVHWSAGKTCYVWKQEYTAKNKTIKSYCMSPNVFYYDGIFYLFYATRTDSTYASRRIYYATSDSPYGPFVGQTMLHDVTEIGGHPYLDESGKVYISLSRFDYGGCIYLEELSIKDGVITPVEGTLTLAVMPTEEYEIDGRGRVCEGGVLYKHEGYYYLIYATSSYRLHYGEAYAVSENILGPYTKYEYNNVLTYNRELDGPGDAVFVQSPDGTELYMAYHRHSAVGTVSPRMTCIDRVAFVDDPDGGPDILTVFGPTSTPQPLPSNVYRYDFDRDGRTGLYDLLLLLARLRGDAAYSGTYDVNADGKVDQADFSILLLKLLQIV